MTNQRINDVNTITTISSADRILVNTDVANNILEQIEKDDFIADIVSTDVNNAIEIGTDNKLTTSSDVTLQGNTFNGNSQLIQTNSSGQYPALDGSLITGVSATVDLSPAIELRNIIKSCKLDENGECDLLENPQEQQEVISQYPKPLLSSDGTIGVSQFATFVSHPYTAEYGYKMFDGGLDQTHMADTNPSTSVNGYMGWHCLTPLCVKSLKIINDTYSGSYTLYGGYLQGSNDTTNGSDGTWTNIARFDNTNHNLGGEWYITASSNTTYYNAYRFFLDTGRNHQRIGEVEFEDVTFVDQASAGSSVIVQSTSVNPLIYVNPNGTTSTITSQNNLDFSSGYANGKYPLIQLSDGTVDVASSYTESKKEPTTPTNNDYWLNTSVIPNTLQKYVTSEWVEKQGVFIGNVNVASNLVSSVEQPVIRNIQSVVSGAASMPSSKYIELVFGASNTQYIAPANGWFVLHAYTSNYGMILLYNITSGFYSPLSRSGGTGGGAGSVTIIPVIKDDIVKIIYENYLSNGFIRFHYSEGEV